jgi:hypothetical protein
MIRGSIKERLLVDIGYTVTEVNGLSERLHRIGDQAQLLSPTDPRLARLHELLGAQPRIESVLADSVGILLGTGGWLVTPHDRLPATDAAVFERFLDNLVQLAGRLVDLNLGDPDA